MSHDVACQGGAGLEHMEEPSLSGHVLTLDQLFHHVT